jgi:hypothetical protein
MAELQKALDPMQAAFTALTHTAESVLKVFAEALHAVVLPLSASGVSKAIAVANETAISKLTFYLNEAKHQIGEIYPIRVSAARRDVSSNCSSAFETVRYATEPKIDTTALEFRMMNSALQTQLDEIYSAIEELMKGPLPFPEVTIESL